MFFLINVSLIVELFVALDNHVRHWAGLLQRVSLVHLTSDGTELPLNVITAGWTMLMWALQMVNSAKKKGKSQSSSGLPFDLTNHRDSGRFEIPDLSTFDTEIQRLREKNKSCYWVWTTDSDYLWIQANGDIKSLTNSMNYFVTTLQKHVFDHICLFVVLPPYLICEQSCFKHVSSWWWASWMLKIHWNLSTLSTK